VKDIIKLKFVIIGISTIITIYAYSSISANSSQLAPIIENLVANFWICKNGTVGTSLAPLASRWHGFFFPDKSGRYKQNRILPFTLTIYARTRRNKAVFRRKSISGVYRSQLITFCISNLICEES
jgi:hypothetical protein